MKISSSCRIAVIAVLLSALSILLSSCSDTQEESNGILSYIPEEDEVAGWNPVDEPQVYVGEDLFLLINGGAEIYHEYGFKQVVFQEFESAGGKSINMELFQMEDPASAYGIYTFKTGENGTEMDIGGGLMLEEYYLNFWKNDLLVTLIGFDSEKETIDGLHALARGIADRITEDAEKPALFKMLPSEDLKTSGIKYLHGNLALYNNYEFDSADIFRFRECILGKYGDHRLLIFKYSGDDDTAGIFKNAGDIIRESGNFSEFKVIDDNTFSAKDKNSELAIFRINEKYILTYIGSNIDQAQSVFSGIIDR